MQSISLYDILSKVIPGSMAFFLLGIYHWTGQEKLGDVMALFVVYLIGYLIDTISGILERLVLYRSFGGIPSEQLLIGKSFSKIKIYDLTALTEYLNCKYPELYPNLQACFLKIYSMVNKTELPRVKSFLEAYVFSRNILFAFVLTAPLFLISHFSWAKLVGVLGIAFLFWYNSKSRAYYFAKEVIDSFLREYVSI